MPSCQAPSIPQGGSWKKVPFISNFVFEERFERLERFVRLRFKRFNEFKRLEAFSVRERFNSLRWFKGLTVGSVFHL